MWVQMMSDDQGLMVLEFQDINLNINHKWFSWYISVTMLNNVHRMTPLWPKKHY